MRARVRESSDATSYLHVVAQIGVAYVQIPLKGPGGKIQLAHIKAFHVSVYIVM
jgi:hypothetical protein